MVKGEDQGKMVINFHWRCWVVEAKEFGRS